MTKKNGNALSGEDLVFDPLETAAVHLTGNTVFYVKRELERADRQLRGVADAAGSEIISQTTRITAVPEQQLELL